MLLGPHPQRFSRRDSLRSPCAPVTIYLDNTIVHFFKMRAGSRCYQTLINETLARFIQERDLEDMIRRVVREELSDSKRESA